MSNVITTNNDLGSIVLWNASFRDELIQTAPNTTLKAGTILGRDEFSENLVPFVKLGPFAATGEAALSGTATEAGLLSLNVSGNLSAGIQINSGETGESKAGTITNAVNAQVNLSIIAETVGNSSKLIAKAAGFSGNQITLDWQGGPVGGITTSITPMSGGVGSFVEEDVENDNLKDFNEHIPCAVLTYPISFGGLPAEKMGRVLISGKVRKEHLVIDAFGDDSQVDNLVLDQLREVGIVALNVEELNTLDNQ